MRRFAPPASRTVIVRLFIGICLAAGLAVTTIQAQIPGRNVNMVSGSKWPDGDPFLQRQNEPSIAASTRNPLHLLAGANDYRTVDLPGLPGDEIGDAWLGLFKSYDGGQRWTSTLLPGYPQDRSPEGLASPIKGYAAGADPVVRAGTSGLIYYAGLVFDRSPAGSDIPGKSAIFVSRFIDNNNKEAGDPFAYLGTSALAADPGGATGNFLDKPWLAVDIPRDATRCVITTPGEDGATITQSVPAGPLYVAYTLRSTDKQGPRYDVYFTRSTNCGGTWTTPVRLNNQSERANQGATLAIDPRNGNVYIGWRQFDLTGDNDAVMSVKYTAASKRIDPPGFAYKFGKNKAKGKGKGLNAEQFYTKGGVSKAIEAAQLSPLDQATSDIAGLLAFRTNAYPSLTVDGAGRVYMAWAERGYEPLAPDPIDGNARILVSSSPDGRTWTAPQAVAVEGQGGHQLMPTITFAGGKLMLVYYDLRETRSEVLFSRYIDDVTALRGVKQRRHTIDLRASMAAPGAVPVFAPSVRVSDYMMGAGSDGVRRQLQVNPPNLPMFKLGTAPFMGDYVDVTAAPNFVVDANGSWTYNTAPAASLPVFHAVWTDNRDVRPPLEDPDGDGNPWNNFIPAGTTVGAASLADPTKIFLDSCIPGNAGSRNQNIYTARITGGILAGSPGNSKQLGYRLDGNGQPTSELMQRAFVVFVQNTASPAENNTATKTFRLAITGQPVGGRASFDQFSAAPLTVIDTVVAARSTSSRTVYVTSTDPDARIHITVTEVASIGGAPIAGGLGSVVVLNPDIDNPDIDNPDIDNPDIDNPDIDNVEVYNPDIDNPDIDNPDIDNPDIDNPDIDNPDIDNVVIANPDIDNPDIDNPDIDNPDIDNPDIDNPDIDNPDIDNASLTDVSWSITNTGNTSASYNVNLFFAQTTIKPELTTQLILYRTYRTPIVVNCQLKYETRNILVANVPNPELVKSSTGTVSDPNDPELTNATIWLAPGESAKITLRIYDRDASDNVAVTFTNPDGTTTTALIDPSLVPNEDVTPVVQQQGVNTEDADKGVTEPPIVVQFPAPQAAPDAAATAPNTPVTFNVLANDSTAFGSTKVISLHPPNMAAHSGGGPGDIAFQSSTGFLYTQRGIIDPATDVLVGRLPLPPGNAGIQYQVANQRTGINYGRTVLAGGGLTALDARPGSPTFHGYLPMPAIADTVFSFAIDATHHRLYVIHGPNSGPQATSLSVVDINPASGTFHSVLSSVAILGSPRGQSVAVNTRTQKVYVSATGTAGGVYVFDGTQQLLQPPVKVAGTTGAWSILVNEAANLAYASTFVNGSFFGLHVIDGATNALATVPTAELMRTSAAEERLAVHLPTGRVLMRLETTVVIIDTQRGSPTRNTVVGTVGVGREFGGVDIAVDQELGLAVTAGSYDFRADIIDIEAGALTETIALKAGSTDVAIDPVGHRAFVAVPLTHVQEIDLLQQEATAEVPVFIESGGMVVNPVRNRAYAGILGVGGSVGVVSGSGFNGTIAGLNLESRYLFSTRYDATNHSFIVNQGNPDGTSYGPGMVVAIDGATDLLADEVSTLPNPFGIGLNQADGKLYVASLSSPGQHGGINVFDANNLGGAAPVQATLAAGFPLNNNTPNTALLGFGRHVVVNASVANPNSGKVYAMQIGGSPTSLVVIDPVNNIITPLDGLATALPGGLPAGAPLAAPGSGAPGLWGRVEVIRAAPALNRVYLGMYDGPTNTNRIVALDGTTDQVVGSWVGGRHSNRHTASYLIVNEATNRLYVTNYETDTLTMLDATTLLPVATAGAPLGEITLPDGPSALAFNYTSNRLYVSSITAKTLTAIDGATLAPQSSVKMPLVAQFLYVDEVESRVYTSGGDSSDESGIMVITDVLGQLGTNVSVSSITQPDHGVAMLNPDNSITYTPDPGYSGPDQFGYSIAAQTGTADGVVNITVVPANPRAVSFVDGYTTGMNQLLTVPAPGVLANDATGDPAATAVFTDTTTNGTLTTAPDGSFTYQPDPGFVGMDEFEYHTVGLLGVSNTTKVVITVTAAGNLMVTNTSDSGVGSLRQAMTTANLEPGSVIAFDIPGAGPHTIQPTSALPTMNVPVTIDGYTQPGAVVNSAAVGTNAQLKIILRGVSAGGGSGLSLRGGNSTVRGLVINGFTSGSGIRLDSAAGGNVIEGNFIGTTVTGTAASANRIGVTALSPGDVIGGATAAARNLISGSSLEGILVQARLDGSGAVVNQGSGTAIRNNLVGTNAAGLAALANAAGGILVLVPDVTIGGTTAAERNVISGNGSLGINAIPDLLFPAVGNGPPTPVTLPTGLVVQGNYIGTTADGLAALANTGGGITSSGAATIIGGSNPTPSAACSGACNLIAGNGGNGLTLNNTYDSVFNSPTVGTIYSSAVGSRVEGNYIGVNVTGTAAIANGSQGIQLTAAGITVGGGTAATRNVISGHINGGSSGLSVGSNIVTNAAAGFNLVVATAEGAVIRGNYIGLNAAGTAALPNASGVSVSVPDVTIGGIVAGDRNIISGNTQSGINTFASTFTATGVAPVALTTPARLIVKGNYIGVTADGTAAVANVGSGLWATGEDSVIGGVENTSALSCTGACNLISGNTTGSGLSVTSHFNNTPGAGLGDLYSSGSRTQVLGNFIGVNLTGTAAIPNGYGMFVNAPSVVVGGPAAGARNVVAGNTNSGISVSASYVTSTNLPVASGTGSQIKGNVIGISVDGTTRIANGQCGICSYAAGVIIGGPGLNEGNRVAGGTSSTGINLGRQFTSPGNVLVEPSGNSTVEGNIIGLSTTNARLNGGTGIDVSSASNTIRGNVVAGNGTPGFAAGIRIGGAFANLNSIKGNTIGTNLAGAGGLGNSGTGISLNGGASNNTIGGLNAVDANVIVGNGGNGGVEFYAFSGNTMTGNVVQGNYIGVLPTGGAIANNTGIRIYANPPSGPLPAGIVTGNTIGGSAPGARNVISGNTGDGINLGGAGTTNNTIAGNYIGTTIDGLLPLPNTGSGISLSEGGGNTVGGGNAGDGNLIAFNGSRGVVVWSNSTGNRILGNAIRANASLAIDLGGDGATLNDDGDVDLGANGKQNFPVLLSAANSGGTTGVDADLSSFAAGQYTLQFFASATCDANGNSRAERLAGSFDLVGAGGTQTFQLTPPLAAGEYLTATATDAAGNTSELSPCLIQADVIPTAVTNTNNSGSGSLRNAITYSNTVPGAQTITFNIPGAGPHTIQPTSMLPILAGPVVIDGYTQPGATPNTLATGGTDAVLKIVLNGANAAGAWAGLSVGSGGATIRGLVINGYIAGGGTGVYFDSSAGGNVLSGNFIGTDASGAVAVPNGNGVRTNSPGTVIGGSLPADRNLISGNTMGVVLSASFFGTTVNYQATGSSVRNNLIGTNAAGTAALANSGFGIHVDVANVTIGGTNPVDRNVVSGNNMTGINTYPIVNAGTVVTVPSGLRVEGNYIGTRADGLAAIPNGNGGISVTGANSIIGGTTGTTPGGACTGACNLISGNNFSGLRLINAYDYTTGAIYSSASNSVVAGNYIGVDVAGTAALPNTSNGVDITAPTVTVGGDTPEARNLVSGNGSVGIGVGVNYTATFTPLAVTGAGSVIRGNFIGVNAAGTAALGNAQYGVASTAANVTIGGPNAADRNVIFNGILLSRLMNGATEISAGGSNTVQGNHIGVDLGGTIRMNSGLPGIWVETATNQILGNVIAGLGVPGPSPVYVAGVMVSGAPATGNSIRGNYIGTNPAGAAGLENTGDGVVINNTSNNTIGGLAPADRNVIAGNNNGVAIYASNGATANGNVVLGNYLGVKPDGVTALPNSLGVIVTSTGTGAVTNTVIGGAAAGSRNVIAGNTSNGIGLYGAGTTGTTIAGNYIGIAADAVTDRGNAAAGIWVSDAANSTIGGANPGDANIIAFNDQTGVGVQNPTALGNRIFSNRIFGNGSTGIDLINGGNNNVAAPVLSNAANTGPTTTVVANLAALAPGAYEVEFFQGSACGQGDTFVSRFVNINQGPAALLTLTELVPAGRWLTATATDASGNTSSFSACALVADNPLIVTNTTDTGNGSLRNALTYANSTPGTQTITFNIPGAGPGTPATIAPATALPTITEAVVIDAKTQPGYVDAPVIELDGSGIAAAQTNGLTITGSQVTVRGLSVTGFPANGIRVSTGNQAVIEDNWIGIRPSGALARNTRLGGTAGIDIADSSSNVIARNVISGHSLNSWNAGVFLYGTANNNSIQNNRIGTAPDGLSAMANRRGVVIEGRTNPTPRPTGNVITANLIAGNTAAAIEFSCGNGCGAVGTFITDNTIGLKADDSLLGNGTGIVLLDGPGTTITNNRIAGGTAGISISESAPVATTAIEIKANKIGTDSTGLLARPAGTGIVVAASAVTIPVLIGGALPGEGNRIAFNTGIGVNVLGTGVTVRSNSIEGNGGLGIDLGGDGVTANDGDDSDGGPNGRQNTPVIAGANVTPPATEVQGTLQSAPNTQYTLQLFRNTTCDASGSGEGAELRDTQTVTTAFNGQGFWTLTSFGPPVGGAQWTVTATDPLGNTSEFSACWPGGASSTLVTNTNDSGAGSLRDAITNSNTQPGTQTISFNIPGATPGVPAIIPVLTPLPVITGAVIIDGSTQPGFDGLPIVEVTGNGAIANGFETNSDVAGVQIKSLAVTRFTNAGIMLMQAENLSGHTVSGNYIGTDRFGNAGKGNSTGLVVRADGSNINNNSIAGNLQEGIRLENDADSVSISSNNIGRANGVTRGNGADGIRLYDSLNNNTIFNNTIVANAGWGVDIQDSVAGDVTGTTFYGNRIGVDEAGNDLGNAGGGIQLNNAPSTQVGVSGQNRNIISGNGGPNPINVGVGISVVGNAVPMPVIHNNYIGTNPAGLLAVPNVNKGISLTGPAIVGGDQPGQGNLIAGHAGVGAGGAGIIVQAGGSGSVIRGNTIGLAADGSVLGNEYSGITVFSNVTNVTIGGTTAGAGNVISGNGSFGISFPVGPTSGATIQGNFIGTAADGTTQRSNSGPGIRIVDGTNHTIGGWNGANTIAYNAGSGVAIVGNTSAGIRVEDNRFHDNTGLGIDLGQDGVTANDPADADTGANDLQNFPELTSATNTGPGGNTILTMNRNLTAGTYLVILYQSPSCHALGNGEGKQSLYRLGLTYPGPPGPDQITFGFQVPVGWFLTATATSDATGNTSEFSTCVQVTP